MKIERIFLAIAFLAMVVGCTAMNTQAPAPVPVDEGVWQKSAAWLPLQVVVEGEDGKREVQTQRAPLDFNTETRMFRLHVEEEKPVDAPEGEKVE